MKTRITLFLILFTLINWSQNAYGGLRGKLINTTKENVICEIKTLDTIYISKADTNGTFKFNCLPPGFHQMEIIISETRIIQVENICVKKDQISFLEDLMLSDSTDTIYIKDLISLQKHKTNIINMDNSVWNHLRTSNIGHRSTSAATSETVEYFFENTFYRSKTYCINNTNFEDLKRVSLNNNFNYKLHSFGMPAKFGDTFGLILEIETLSYMDIYNNNIKN